MAVLSTARAKAAVTKYGGGIILVREVDQTGQTISATDTVYHDLGYIQECTFSDNTDSEDIKDETGNTVVSESGDRTVKLTGILMQTDKATLDLAADVRDKYFRVFRYDGQNNSKHKELFFGICRIKPSVEYTSPSNRRVPFEITVLKNDTACVLGTAELITVGSAYTGYPKAGTTAQTIAADAYYKTVETAV